MIFIRADGNAKIGAGHLMRCMTVAECLREKEKVVFLTAYEESVNFIREKGYEVILLNCYRFCPVETGMEKEIPELRELVTRYMPRSILVDSYHITPSYFEKLSEFVPVIYMDDFGKERYCVDKLFNYNIFADENHYRRLYEGTNTEYCIGPEFIPIRAPFRQIRYQVGKELKRVLFMTGGGDYYGLTEKFMDTFGNNPRFRGMSFYILCGSFNSRTEFLKKKAEEKENFYIFENIRDIWNLMSKSDLAISAGGTTVYELCSLGVPFLGYSFADNQIPVLKYLQEHKVISYCGDYRELKNGMFDNMETALEKYRSYDLRKEAGFLEQKCVDGRGAGRIADRILT